MKWNVEFLNLVDKLVTQMSTADVIHLASKCCMLMASDIHKITLFTPNFVNNLINCIHPFVFKIYLLPYMSWFDCSILKQLFIFSGNEEALNIVNHFINSLDYNKPITSYPIPEFSQLMVTLDKSHYTLVATKHSKSIDTLILQDLLSTKKLLMQRLELTEHAVHLAGVRTAVCCFYWLLPKQVQPLVESKMNGDQLELWGEGRILTKLLPQNFFSHENSSQQNDDLFCIHNENSEDRPVKV